MHTSRARLTEKFAIAVLGILLLFYRFCNERYTFGERQTVLLKYQIWMYLCIIIVFYCVYIMLYYIYLLFKFPQKYVFVIWFIAYSLNTIKTFYGAFPRMLNGMCVSLAKFHCTNRIMWPFVCHICGTLYLGQCAQSLEWSALS